MGEPGEITVRRNTQEQVTINELEDPTTARYDQNAYRSLHIRRLDVMTAELRKQNALLEKLATAMVALAKSIRSENG